MKPVLILFATREGHTRRIVERIATTSQQKGVATVVRDLSTTNGAIDFRAFSGVILAGPIHAGKHPRQLVELVKTKRQALSELPTLLLTVCLAQAGVENPSTPADKRAAAERAVAALIADFNEQTGFLPTYTKTVAGALPYTQYNFFIRWVMKRIVAKEGGDTDTSRDYVYTNWAALDRTMEDFLGQLDNSNGSNDESPARLAS
jgi:menaquinone-dependent protoporphyrinogen oxidase